LIPWVCENTEGIKMSWNAADRLKYAAIGSRYSSDLSDTEFALIAPLLPAAKMCGRKRTDPRIILNALFYLVRSGCPWRLLPKDFPPFTTVQNQFYAWRDNGLWTQIVAVLVMAAREAQDREAAPTAIVVDSQSVKTTEAGGPRGYDADKSPQRGALSAEIKGFVVLPKRWVVERTFGWINRARRLAKDFEATLKSALAWLQIALAFLVIRRLAKALS
jgi:transposase